LLRRLAAAGPRDFYEAESARMMVADLQAGGSVLSLEDFAAYAPRWLKPLTAGYRGWQVNAVPGLSGGPSLLDALKELSTTLKAGPTLNAAATLAYARAIRNAYQTRLTSMGHAAPALADCTTHISVVDRDGNMVSLTNTLLSRFGSKVTLPQAGILMNNGISWFDPRPDQPNSIKAGARPLANMCPLILSRAGKPTLAIGAAGGRQIFPALAQLVSYLLDFGMSLEEAFHAPRVDASTPVIKVNRRAAADVAATVAQAYRVEIVDDTLYPVNFAVPSAVARDGQTGLNRGMAHPTNPWSDAAVGEPTHGG
jgi:gamma-glutamyltranspeptidase/glutathione hydrolase